MQNLDFFSPKHRGSPILGSGGDENMSSNPSYFGKRESALITVKYREAQRPSSTAEHCLLLNAKGRGVSGKKRRSLFSARGGAKKSQGKKMLFLSELKKTRGEGLLTSVTREVVFFLVYTFCASSSKTERRAIVSFLSSIFLYRIGTLPLL